MAVAVTLEGVEDHYLKGWAIDPANSKKRVTIQLCQGETVLAERRADLFRPDLEAAGVGDGRHAFVLKLPEQPYPEGSSFEVRVPGKQVAVGGAQLDRISREILDSISSRLCADSNASITAIHGHSLEARFDLPKAVSGTVELAFDGALVWEQPASRVATVGTPVVIPIPSRLRVPGEHRVSITMTIDSRRFPLLDDVILLEECVPCPRGRIDGVHEGVVRGWAWDENDPLEIVQVSIFIDDRFISTVRAEDFREDLHASNIRGGKAAFSCEIPRVYLDGQVHVVHAELVGHTSYSVAPQEFQLASPKTLNPEIFLDAESSPKAAIVTDAAEPVRNLLLTSQPLSNAKASRNLRRKTRTRMQVDVIVPVYDAPDHLERCLDALERNTTYPYRLILIDDGSTDPKTKSLLNDAVLRMKATLVTNPSNCGFTKSVNIGLEHSLGDVVLLNSDTEVGPRWLQRLVYTAYSDTGIATVSAMSPNAGAFSVPRIYESNPLIAGLSKDEHSALMGRSTGGVRMAVPTGHGFCMLIRREALEEIGNLDEQHFPRGYGEENDFCMRALKAGFSNLVDGRVIVHHAKGASFGPSRDALLKAGQAQLRNLHPEYTRLTTVFRGPSELSELRARAQHVETWASRDRNTPLATQMAKPRILFVLHYAGEGGTALTTEDLVKEVSHDFDCFLLTPHGDEILLSRWDQKWIAISKWKLRAPIDYLAMRRPDYEAVVSNILVDFDFSLVHVRHLIGHDPVVLQAADELNIPVVWSLHDFYQVCPSVSLVDAEGNYCGGRCTPGASDCSSKISLPENYGRLRNGHIQSWQYSSSNLARHASAVVTTSKMARDLTKATIPGLKERPYFVIEHGRDRSSARSVASPPRRAEPVRILMLGNILPEYKGFNVARAIHELDEEGAIEFHFLGPAPIAASEIGIVHGRYERTELIERISDIAPSFIAIFSTWPETYCHTVSEAWLAGVPVLGSHLGAVGERIMEHGGGWQVNCSKPGEILKLVKDLRDDPERYSLGRNSASAVNLRDVRDMGSDYRLLYKSLVESHYEAPGDNIVRVLLSPPEVERWGSVGSRWRALLRHSAVRRLADIVQLRTDEVQQFGYPKYAVLPKHEIFVDLSDGSARGLSDVQPDTRRFSARTFDLHLRFINELPWTSAALLPSESLPPEGRFPCVAVLARSDISNDPEHLSWLGMIHQSNCEIKVIDVSSIPESTDPRMFAREVRARLRGCSAVVPVSPDKWAICDSLNLAEVALLGLPLLILPDQAEALRLSSNEAVIVGKGGWAKAIEKVGDAQLNEFAVKAGHRVVDEFGLTRHAPKLIREITQLAASEAAARN